MIKVCVFLSINMCSLVSSPVDKNIIGNKQVFCIKRKPNNDIDHYKTLLVTKIYNNQLDIDYNETFSLIVG